MWTNLAHELILASASARRLALLEQIAVPVRQLVVPTTGEDEPRLANESVTDYVMRTALEKNQRTQKNIDSVTQAQTQPATSVPELPHLSNLPILSADTTVAIGEQILGKPRDRDDARRILTTLAGQTHDVYTAVVLRFDGQTTTALVHARVRMAPSLAPAIEDYIDSGEPFGKAGAYAIQGIAAAYVPEVLGSYSAVVGLPLYETAQLLRDARLYR